MCSGLNLLSSGVCRTNSKKSLAASKQSIAELHLTCGLNHAVLFEPKTSSRTQADSGSQAIA